jgi:hypothetical protein
MRSIRLCLVLILVLIVAGGWATNIVKLTQLGMSDAGMIVLRAVGIFVAPLGVILGFI